MWFSVIYSQTVCFVMWNHVLPCLCPRVWIESPSWPPPVALQRQRGGGCTEPSLQTSTSGEQLDSFQTRQKRRGEREGRRGKEREGGRPSLWNNCGFSDFPLIWGKCVLLAGILLMTGCTALSVYNLPSTFHEEKVMHLIWYLLYV